MDLNRTLFIAFVTVVGAGAPAAAQTGTDIFLVEITETDGRVAVTNVERATDRPGYDNQPYFLPDGGAFLYTSIDDSGQADIYRYDLGTGRSVQVTRTAPESEYSATPIPETDRFAVIRVEADSIQRLWSFAMDGTDPQVVLEELRPIGYQGWLDSTRLAVFVLGNPATLQAATVGRDTHGVVARNIGRAVHPVPGRDGISFLHRGDPDGDWIKEYRWSTGAIFRLIQPRPGNEYFAWTPERTLVTGEGSLLYQWREDDEGDWIEAADLAQYGIQGISRIAVSPNGDWIALVAEEAAAEQTN